MTERCRWGTKRCGIGLLLPVLMTICCTPGDFGQRREFLLQFESQSYFGFGTPLLEPASASVIVARELAAAHQRQLLADGLRADFVARNVARLGDMIAFWPDDIQYTHLILCIEQGRAGETPEGGGGLNVSLQRVAVATGTVEIILHGMDHCDGVRTTPWGTILATEERADGSAYEVFDPLATTGHWIAARGKPGEPADIRTGIDSVLPSTQVAKRTHLPVVSWEGLSVLRNGVVYGVDELRPGSGGRDADGGAIFKFVPDYPFVCQQPISGSPRGEGGVCANPISTPDDSPLLSGEVFALQVSCLEPVNPAFPQAGQGCEVGKAAWLKVDAAKARSEAGLLGATGYYRPEDLHRLRSEDEEAGVTLCWTNTGRSAAAHFGEVVCAADEEPLGDGTVISKEIEYLADPGQPRGLAVVTVNRILEGDDRFNAFDNLDIQPLTGNFFVSEDAPFGEIFACLPDGADRDRMSDGCVSMLSVRDPSAEPTGFIFDGTGEVAYYVLQHGQQPQSLRDFASNPLDGTTDDLIVITGFRTRKVGNRDHAPPRLPASIGAILAAMAPHP